eukprot:CAMPEP_0182924574 /NCGR_PEP_ID=MMETSP0105_2-20130417/6679_1 /TAXON_ID=81532 ORGANISM="Acanthoeca-like sp., Strain 10tr" /NCGR_SAMPLE_ID=MMETSP0105_2 /ASSEMBLY_ACC=CAM_ASM_000205 /LENGTH=383 /DNA_ID=CAMNT_0025062369 /DNA_START=31 /DNA_END=1182 /DNA_ORIENTATION=+
MAGSVVAAAVVSVWGHGAMVTPRSRNSVDFNVGVNTQRCSNVTGDTCQNGQASFWYSQGCFIGCPTCDNMSGRRQVDLCGLGKKQTLTDPKYWSVNRDAVPGSPNDIYKHNPWRAPGSAPVMDACGLAGGSYSRQSGAEAGDYTKTQYAMHGDVGTQVLKPLPNYEPPTYTRGGTAEVTWSMRNNHGGGYQYRLCPLPEGNFTELTEACFQQHPLDFVQDEQAIVFKNGTLLKLTAEQTTFVSEGTMPAGSTWSMIPMPPTLLGPCCIPGTNDTDATPFHCNPGETGVAACKTGCEPCPGTPGSDCSRCDQVGTVLPDRYKPGIPPFPAPCDGCEGVDWNGLSVRDVVKIPSDLPAGKYILGFRYDCEATAQVWSNCADVTLI